MTRTSEGNPPARSILHLVRVVRAVRLPERIAAPRSTDRGGKWALPEYAAQLR